MTPVPEAYLTDAGVFLRWFVKQVGWEHAREIQKAFLAGAVRLETPDSVRIEVAHVLRTKGLVPRLLTRDQYLALIRAIDDLGVLVHSSDPTTVERAGALAADRSLRFFDALVVDRALQRRLVLLTSDAKLVRAVEGLVSTELLRGVGRAAT